MKKLCQLLASLAFVVGLLPAYAVAVDFSEEIYFVKFHFSREAFGRSVKTVTVHIGVLQQDFHASDNRPYWSDIKDVELTRVGGHFFGFSILKGRGNSEGLADLGPVVQYWVQFDGGGTLITDSVALPVTQVGDTISLEAPGGQEEWTHALNDAQDRLRRTAEVESTSAEMIKAIQTRKTQ